MVLPAQPFGVLPVPTVGSEAYASSEANGPGATCAADPCEYYVSMETNAQILMVVAALAALYNPGGGGIAHVVFLAMYVYAREMQKELGC